MMKSEIGDHVTVSNAGELIDGQVVDVRFSKVFGYSRVLELSLLDGGRLTVVENLAAIRVHRFRRLIAYLESKRFSSDVPKAIERARLAVIDCANSDCLDDLAAGTLVAAEHYLVRAIPGWMDLDCDLAAEAQELLGRIQA